jgi:hypothetical protein
MTPEQCATVLAVIAQDNDMGDYVKDVLHQSAAYLTEIPRLLELIDNATKQMSITQTVVDNATAEIQRLNLELTYARSRG